MSKWMIALVLPLLVPGSARADAPARELAVNAAPAAVQQAVQQLVKDNQGLQVDGLEVQERDLNHDGRADWLVVANVTDQAGLHLVNRPLWVFQRDARGLRLLDALGDGLRVEAVPRAAGWEDLRVLAKDGPRLTCTVLGYAHDHYQKKAPCADAAR